MHTLAVRSAPARRRSRLADKSPTKADTAIRRLASAALVSVTLLSGATACGAAPDRFTQQADSMEPLIARGDVIEVDDERTTIGRGDVVVFRLPKDVSSENPVDIKRVVALPGETISFVDGRVVVDGSPLDEPYLRPAESTYALVGKPEETSVPGGSYFVLGDNRGQSRDSRSFGPVDEASIVGVATRIVSPSKRAKNLERMTTGG